MNSSLLILSLSKQITLTEEEKDFFISLLKKKVLKKGEFLLREGEVCWNDSFVVKGSLKNYFVDENGFEHVIDFLIEDWWANDLFSLFTQSPSKSYIRAIEDSEVLQISKENLDILFLKIPKFERFFRILFQNAYIAQQKQIMSTLSADAEERYLSFLKSKPYAETRFSQKDIASYLGVTPQFLSKMKRKISPLNLD